MEKTAVVPFEGFETSVGAAMDRAGAGPVLAEQPLVLLKPNLVNDSPPPITTPVRFVEAVAEYVRDNSRARIVVAEGSGDACRETPEIFEALGYVEMAERLGIELVDLNHAPLRTVSDPACTVFDEMHLPEIGFTAFVISLPVLKIHSLAMVTGALKNMMGFAPPKHYGGGGWKKARFHQRMQASIQDLCILLPPDFCVVDASVGMAEYHLGGAVCDPPIGRILAGSDPFEVDREGARLLGLDPDSVGHLRRRDRA